MNVTDVNFRVGNSGAYNGEITGDEFGMFITEKLVMTKLKTSISETRCQMRLMRKQKIQHSLCM